MQHLPHDRAYFHHPIIPMFVLKVYRFLHPCVKVFLPAQRGNDNAIFWRKYENMAFQSRSFVNRLWLEKDRMHSVSPEMREISYNCALEDKDTAVFHCGVSHLMIFMCLGQACSAYTNGSMYFALYSSK